MTDLEIGDFQIIGNEEAWKDYIKLLDLKYEHKHLGSPTQYPCIVISDWYDDPNGPYGYNHTFLYYKDVRPLVDIYEEAYGNLLG